MTLPSSPACRNLNICAVIDNLVFEVNHALLSILVHRDRLLNKFLKVTLWQLIQLSVWGIRCNPRLKTVIRIVDIFFKSVVYLRVVVFARIDGRSDNVAA